MVHTLQQPQRQDRFWSDTQVNVNAAGLMGGTVVIYDLTGQVIFSGKLVQEGWNAYQVNARTGFYLVRVTQGSYTVTGKVFLTD
ncbi:MAG: T9SS type A sorting domain-containing protein [Bacteroidales bacterium]|nr:T9SS type A sorting domain-containing protein [Bacteroidales bacterium]